MATISKRTNKSGTYYYLVESARVNGKPRIVKQIYLGTAEKIASAMAQTATNASIPEPKLVTVYDFGTVMALYSVADRLGICRIIDEISGKRDQGLPVSAYILLAAINRAVAPTSKNTFYEWFDKTVLYKVFPSANSKNLSSQGFWNNMTELNEKKICMIEDEITKQIVEQYGINTECLLFDNTNFFTYIDTDNASKLAKRGHSKEKRSDLKIVGLSLMVSPDHSIPLFHEVYPGNNHDTVQFSSVIEKLKDRYRKLGKGECVVTLIFDKGNNDDNNIQKLLNESPFPFHFVGGLRLNQCQDLLDIPKADFIPLKGSFHDTTVYRTVKQIYGNEFTVVMTNNPELFKAQMDGVAANIASCEKELAALQKRLQMRKDGIIKKGKKPTCESVNKNVLDILSADHMRNVFDYTVSFETGQTPELTFILNIEKLAILKEKVLGRSILFTDRNDWTNEQIVSAYRSQYHIEEAFKQMKDTKYLSFRPMRHFTDSKIRVHAFYCVLSLVLAAVLNKELEQMGHKMSIHHMIDTFQQAQQVTAVFSPARGKPIVKVAYSRFDGVVKEYADKFTLLKYLN
jgi:transposase